MTEYTISYARFLLRSWGFTRKVPVGRHVKRAGRQKIALFRKKLGPPIEERRRAGYTACVQDEAICVADARPRKGIYTPKGVRGVYTYTGSHSKTIVSGLITIDGGGVLPEIRLLYREGVCRVPEGRIAKGSERS